MGFKHYCHNKSSSSSVICAESTTGVGADSAVMFKLSVSFTLASPRLSAICSSTDRFSDPTFDFDWFSDPDIEFNWVSKGSFDWVSNRFDRLSEIDSNCGPDEFDSLSAGGFGCTSDDFDWLSDGGFELAWSSPLYFSGTSGSATMCEKVSVMLSLMRKSALVYKERRMHERGQPARVGSRCLV